MAFTYSLAVRKNPLKPMLPAKYYAQAQASKVCDFEVVCNRIADRSSATAGDVKLVLDGLFYVVAEAIQGGEIVELGDFGRFQGVLSGSGTETAKEYNVSMIKKVRLQFRPCKAFTGRIMPKALTFKQVAKKPVKEAGKEETVE